MTLRSGYLKAKRKPRLMGLFILLGLLCFSPAIRAASEGNEQARAAYSKAEEFYKSGDSRAARIELLNAIKADPKWIDARVAQAEVLLRLNDGIGAEAELKQAFDLGLKQALVRHYYGHALQLQGNFKRAREQLEAQDIPPPNQGYAARILGRLALQIDDVDLAAKSFDRAIQLDGKNPEVWVDVARFRSDYGDQAGAIAAVEEAVKLAPANVQALQYRGELLRVQFGLKAALPWFERALQIDPNNVAVLTEYAATLGDMGRMTEMLAVARQIIALDGRNPRAFFMQAVLAARAGKYDLARTLLQKTDGQMDGVPAFLLVQAIIEQGDGNYNLAVDKFSRLAKLQPYNLQAQNLLARALYLAGDAEESVNTLKQQVNHGGATPYALWLAGRGLEAIDDRKQAIGVFNRAAIHDIGNQEAFVTDVPRNVLQAEADRKPKDARVVIPYIRTLFNDGELATALKLAKQLQSDNAGTSAAHILVADIALKMGNYDEALDALDKAKKIQFTESVMLRIVDALRAKGDFQRSGELLAQYLSYNPSNVAGLRWMAYAHLETGNWATAAAILEHLRARIGENDALIMAGLAQAYTGLGKSESAIGAGQIAYMVQPSSPVVAHLYGLALMTNPARYADGAALIEKAVTIMPKNITYRQSLDRANQLLNAGPPAT